MTAAVEAMLDSNVIIATLVEDHGHHIPSAALMADSRTRRFAVAAHSYSEAYAILTGHSAAAFGWPAAVAWRTLQSIAAVTTLQGLTPSQTFDAIGGYARDGGIGKRLYDHLIGQVAVHHGVPRIITWNVRHLRGLFPQIEVLDPVTALAPRRA